MRKHSRVSITNTSGGIQVVNEDPGRTRLFLQNNDDDEIFCLHAPGKATNYQECIFLYPHSWVQLDEDDDCDKEWRAGTYSTGGTGYISVTEFYVKPKTRWW